MEMTTTFYYVLSLNTLIWLGLHMFDFCLMVTSSRFPAIAASFRFIDIFPLPKIQGHILILKSIKQRNKNIIKNINVFLLNHFIWTDRKVETKLYLLPIGQNKIVKK